MTSRRMRMLEDKHLRDSARALVEADIEHLKTDVSQKSLATRAMERAREGAAELYEEFAGTALFAAMCAAVTSGPIVALAIDKADAQAAWSELIGPADPAAAREEVRRYLQPRPAISHRWQTPPYPSSPPNLKLLT